MPSMWFFLFYMDKQIYNCTFFLSIMKISIYRQHEDLHPLASAVFEGWSSMLLNNIE